MLHRSFLSVALGLAAAALAGCSSEPVEQQQAPGSNVTHVLVTADTINDLQPGAELDIDVVDNVVYHFDYSAAPIDYARITLVGEDGVETPMEDSMADVAAFDYGTNPPVDLLATPDGRFKLASDPLDFGVKLTDAEIAELKATGYVYKEESAASTQPQTGDNCIEADCEVCPGGWQPPNGANCYIVHHVWCD
ncbi:MAG: hypothetical protein IT372_08555 [Polyangiaceae bacterium]|nr:hypothetical protein [Polyangiaceae bacterium]